MKVGIDIRSLTDPQLTGVGTYTRNIVRGLQQVAPDLDLRLYASGAHELTLKELGIPSLGNTSLIWNRKPKKMLSPRTPGARGPVLDNLVGGADVWFSPNVNFTALSPHVPHVVTVHDLSYALYPQFFSLKRRIWHLATHAQRTVTSATHVLCDSRSTAQDLTRLYGLPTERISVVQLAHTQAEQPTSEEIATVGERFEIGRRYIVAIGTIEPRKNLATLIKAFGTLAEHTSDLELVIIGPMGWKSRSFARAMHESALQERIHVLGYMPEPAKRSLLAGALALYSVSSYEGFGLPALEAMHLGVPVITANVSSLPEVTGETAILVDPERPAEIIRGVTALLEDAELRAILAARGRQRAQEFSWHTAAVQTYTVLRAVAEQGVGIVPAAQVAAEVL